MNYFENYLIFSNSFQERDHTDIIRGQTSPWDDNIRILCNIQTTVDIRSCDQYLRHPLLTQVD